MEDDGCRERFNMGAPWRLPTTKQGTTQAV